MTSAGHRVRNAMSNAIRRAGYLAAVLGLFTPVGAVSGDEFRAFWADAFSQGFKSTVEINTMVARAQIGRYNAIIAEVLAYQDTGAAGHGAYWSSSIVPMASDISGGIDPLQKLVLQAHAAGIEVHAWIVPYRVSTSWSPNGNSYLAARPQWIMVPEESSGGGPATIDGKYFLDPGSPEVQDYIVSIARELAANYDIDGIHLDYIRYVSTNGGYPASAFYSKSGLQRFRDITGYVGTPPYSGDAAWDDFRRREVDELVRRLFPEVHLIASNPRQPLRFTSALLATGGAPSDFSNSLAYELFQNWRHWMEVGWLDAACPMNYKQEHCSSEAAWYRSWIDAAVGWGYGRHVFCGQANYLNSFANSVTQLDYAYDNGADGTVNYSYYGTRSIETICDDSKSWSADTAWYNYVADNRFTSTALTPDMPWHNPATATKGFVYGRVTDGATGQPIDNATVRLGAVTICYTDGNGYYFYRPSFDPGLNGVVVPFRAVASGYAEVQRPHVLVERAGFTEVNFALGTWLPGDYDVDADVDIADFEQLAPCLTGPDAGPIGAGCDIFDFDLDGDVDLLDSQVFQQSFTN